MVAILGLGCQHNLLLVRFKFKLHHLTRTVIDNHGNTLRISFQQLDILLTSVLLHNVVQSGNKCEVSLLVACHLVCIKDLVFLQDPLKSVVLTRMFVFLTSLHTGSLQH